MSENISNFVREANKAAQSIKIKCEVKGLSISDSSLVMIIINAKDTEVFWSSLMNSNKVAWIYSSLSFFDIGSGKQAIYIVKPL